MRLRERENPSECFAFIGASRAFVQIFRNGKLAVFTDFSFFFRPDRFLDVVLADERADIFNSPCKFRVSGIGEIDEPVQRVPGLDFNKSAAGEIDHVNFFDVRQVVRRKQFGLPVVHRKRRKRFVRGDQPFLAELEPVRQIRSHAQSNGFIRVSIVYNF